MMESRMLTEHWGDRPSEMDKMLDLIEAAVRPKIESTEVTVMICSHHGVDAKQAVELGFALMLGKRILIVREPGVDVAEKVLAAADEIVEHDWHAHPKTLPAAVLAGCDRMAARGLI